MLSPVRLTSSLRRYLLGLHISYHLFEADDPDTYLHKIKYILENDVTVLDLTFTDEGPDGQEIDLCPQGSTIVVTKENKHTYLDLLARHRFVDRIEQPLKYFAEAFWGTISIDALGLLNEHDFELMLCGIPDFSVADLREHCKVSPLCDKKSVTFIFHTLESFTMDDRARFLQFVTALAAVPAGGCAAFSPGKHSLHFSSNLIWNISEKLLKLAHET